MADAARLAATTTFYDNSRAATPFRVVATLELGRAAGPAGWPVWTPAVLRDITG